MKNLFFDTRILDKRANDELLIPSEILMENAARGMLEFLHPKLSSNSRILLVCGSGDNGADCLALARMLYGMCKLSIYAPFGAKSTLCQWQLDCLKRIAKAQNFQDIEFLESLTPLLNAEIVVDGIFGAGFKGELNAKSTEILKILNAMNALKIACDMPSGITQNGTLGGEIAFKADFTLTMGALKVALFCDEAKDFVGEVQQLPLGISPAIFETPSPIQLLEKSDFKPPVREKQNTHKGDFGHLCVYLGEKQGAGILCALSALQSGAGLVSVLGNTKNLPYSLMQTTEIPHNTSAIALGMGLGKGQSLESLFEFLHTRNVPLLLDADIFYYTEFMQFLTLQDIILTPHPKEFTQILKATGIATISTQELQKDRIAYAQKFCSHYPNATLILKGANTLIAHNQRIWINPFGNNALAKGGSGDVLSGILSALLTQGYSPLDSAINGVLMHSFCAKSYCKKYNNFSLNPLDLIEQIRYI